MERTEIQIGKKAQTVLKGISAICQSIIIRDDYLYTKYETSTAEEKTKKGAMNIVVEYALPKDEIKLEKEFGIYDIDEFLKVISSFDADNLKLESEGNVIHVKDARKKTTYYTQSTLAMPTKSTAGDALFDAGEISIGMLLTDVAIEQIKKDLGVLPFDGLILKGGGDKVVKLIASNNVTSNQTEIVLDEAMVGKSEEDFEFVFPNVDIFSFLIPDSYGLIIKTCQYNGKKILICKFSAKNIDGLKYTLVSH